MIRVRSFFAFLFVAALFLACTPGVEPKPEFAELRLHRWTGLEGGETIVIRRLGNEWSATLLGDGAMFSCLYQKSVNPKSDWQQLWNEILAKEMDSFPESLVTDYVVEDGNGFDVEFTYQGKLKRLSIPHPEFQNSPEAKQILEISDLLSSEFDTPVFVADYDRGEVGEYLMKNCKDLRK